MWVKHRGKKREVDLLFPVQQVLVGQRGGGGSTVKGSTFEFIPMIICCQECGVLFGPEKQNDFGPALNSTTFCRHRKE